MRPFIISIFLPGSILSSDLLLNNLCLNICGTVLCFVVKLWAFVKYVRLLSEFYPPGKFIQIILMYRLILLFFLLWECSSSEKMTFPWADLLSCFALISLELYCTANWNSWIFCCSNWDSLERIQELIFMFFNLSWSGISEIATSAQRLLTTCPSCTGSSRSPSALWSQCVPAWELLDLGSWYSLLEQPLQSSPLRLLDLPRISDKVISLQHCCLNSMPNRCCK